MAIGNERGAGVGKVGGGKTYTDSGFQYTCNRHTHTHTHTSAHVAGKTKPEAPTCPTSDLFLCICWWKAVQRKKDMEERQAQSEMPQKVKFVFQFVFFFFCFLLDVGGGGVGAGEASQAWIFPSHLPRFPSF